MPALIAHHIFGEDVVSTQPAGMVEGEQELLAFLLGNQGPDPLFARFSALPGVARTCRRLAHEMQTRRTTRSLLALRDGVGRLPVADERVGRAFALGLLGHYVLDRTAHPFVFSQQLGIVEAEPSLAAASREVHAVIESDLDSWLLWEKRRATVEERPAATHLMRTPRVERVGGALLSQVALAAYGLGVGAGEYARCVRDYELLYRLVEPAGSPHSRALGRLERLVRGRSMAEASAHCVRRDGNCPAANLDRRAWRDPSSGRLRHDGFADLFDEARLAYPAFAEAFARGDEAWLRGLVGGLSYEGRPIEDD